MGCESISACGKLKIVDVKESMYWIPIKDFDKYKEFPIFMKDYLKDIPKGIVHIVTDEREKA